MSYGKKSWRDWVLEDEDVVFGLMKKAYDAGIRTFDTADMYSDGASEILVGKFLKKFDIPRSTIVILTKCFMQAATDPSIESNEINWINRWGLSRKHILDAVEGSVERLGTYIDVLQIHRLDHETSKEEIMDALNDVVKSGKVRYLGASSMRAVDFAQLQFIAEKHNWTKFISMQNFYNLIYREEEREMIPYCKETGVGLIPWSPIARGILSRPLGDGSLRGDSDGFSKVLKLGELSEDQEIIRRIEEIAKKRSISMAQVAIAWVLAKGPGICPIVGFNKPERIDEAIDALKIKLSEEEIKYLEEPYIPHPVLGY